MAELVYATDLKSVGQYCPSGFESRCRYYKISEGHEGSGKGNNKSVETHEMETEGYVTGQYATWD